MKEGRRKRELGEKEERRKERKRNENNRMTSCW
jgi:hypothetical protein